MPPLSQWLVSFGVPSLLSIAVTYGAMRLIFRKDLRLSIETALDAEPLKSEGKLVLIGLGVMVLTLLLASTFKKDLGLPACLAALVITAVVSIKARTNQSR